MSQTRIQTSNRLAAWACALVLGTALGCAGKSKGAKSPAECLAECDQEACDYVANGQGDNDEYLECLEACQDKCGG